MQGRLTGLVKKIFDVGKKPLSITKKVIGLADGDDRQAGFCSSPLRGPSREERCPLP
jgi:hypothetical protein